MKRVHDRSVLTVACAALAVLALGACQKPLLAEDEERTPFDKYDATRNQYAQQDVTDPYGRKRPNLRDRLGKKD